MSNYKLIDKETYYRKGVYRHFTEDCKCSVSMTARIDVTDLAAFSKSNGTKFYINFLYLLCKVLNSREDYRMQYCWQTDELVCFDKINPAQYVFHEDTETCTPVYTEYFEDYKKFYENAAADLEKALRDALDGISQLVFNFEKLEYISSAGLRVLLSTQKIMNQQGSMKVRHVNETIMEIFDITGFTDILTIE